MHFHPILIKLFLLSVLSAVDFRFNYKGISENFFFLLQAAGYGRKKTEYYCYIVIREVDNGFGH